MTIQNSIYTAKKYLDEHEGVAYKEIARYLNSLNHKTKRGKPFTENAVSSMLIGCGIRRKKSRSRTIGFQAETTDVQAILELNLSDKRKMELIRKIM